MTRLVSDGPVRPLRLARRGLSGRVSLTGGATAGHESSLERDWLMALDFDLRVQRLLEQPYTLRYLLHGKKRRYTPDVLAEFQEGARRWTEVYEVKPREFLREHWADLRPRYQAAMADCRSNGWRFRIVTERHIRTPYLENVKFLRRYRRLAEHPTHRQALLCALSLLGTTTPQTLLAAVWEDPGERLAGLPELWRLVAHRAIVADLTVPLTMVTPIGSL